MSTKRRKAIAARQHRADIRAMARVQAEVRELRSKGVLPECDLVPPVDTASIYVRASSASVVMAFGGDEPVAIFRPDDLAALLTASEVKPEGWGG